MRSVAMQGLTMARWTFTALLAVGYTVEVRRRRRAEARVQRLVDEGAVDLEPAVAATEDLVAALRLNGSRSRCEPEAAIRVLP